MNDMLANVPKNRLGFINDVLMITLHRLHSYLPLEMLTPVPVGYGVGPASSGPPRVSGGATMDIEPRTCQFTWSIDIRDLTSRVLTGVLSNFFFT